MATDLYIIANLSMSKAEVLQQKDLLVERLNRVSEALLSRFSKKDSLSMLQQGGNWMYEFPSYYDFESEEVQIGSITKEVLDFSGDSIYSIYVYEDCMILSSGLRYAYIYRAFEVDLFLELPYDYEELKEFRTAIQGLVSVFGCSEIIYLADNGCDKLTDFLLQVEGDGASYVDIKKQMESDGIPIVRKYDRLDSAKLDYSNIIEYVFDDFSDLEIIK